MVALCHFMVAHLRVVHQHRDDGKLRTGRLRLGQAEDHFRRSSGYRSLEHDAEARKKGIGTRRHRHDGSVEQWAGGHRCEHLWSNSREAGAFYLQPFTVGNAPA